MSVKCSFMDNCMYGADDINNVFSKLTLDGVSLFKDNKKPLTDMNDAIKNFTTAGIDMYNQDSCRVIYNSDNKTFSILCGYAFMSDGSFISIENDNYDITEKINEMRKNNPNDIYVYFYRNTGNNTIDILLDTDETKIRSSLAVPLAKINKENIITDLRSFARTKLAPCSANVILSGSFKTGRMDYDDEMLKRKKYIIPDVFSGATHVYFKKNDAQKVKPHCIAIIQKCEENTDANLEYTLLEDEESLYVAVNRVRNGLEVWMKVTSNFMSESKYDYIVF